MKLGVLGVALLLSATAHAAVPRVFSYTGTLADAAGNAVEDGNYTVTFRFLDAVEGGGAVWENTYSVTTISGVFTALLGTNSAVLDPSLFARDQVWLEIAVEGETLSPRLRVVAVPYALAAGSLECEGCVQAVDVDAAEVQVRVTDSCTGGQAVSAINEDGTVVCVNSGGSLVAGPGITIDDSKVSASFAGESCPGSKHVCGFSVAGEVDCCVDKVGSGSPGFTCDGTDKVAGWESDNTPICQPDKGGGGDGTVKEILTPVSGGLTGGRITVSGSLGIATAGVKTEMIANHQVSEEFGTADLGVMECTGGTWDPDIETCQVGTNPVRLYSRVLTDPGLYLFFLHLNHVEHDLLGGNAVALQLRNVDLGVTVDPDDPADTWDYRFNSDATAPADVQYRSISRTFIYDKSSSALSPETVEVNAFTNGGQATIGGFDFGGLAGHGSGMRVVLLKR